jgi:hypothetical protein
VLFFDICMPGQERSGLPPNCGANGRLNTGQPALSALVFLTSTKCAVRAFGGQAVDYLAQACKRRWLENR